MTARSVSVVIPVFNSGQVLPELVARLEPVSSREAARFELILVNDGSRDRSWETICRLSAAHSWIRGIDLMRNYGQHNALLCGVRAATGELIVTMDDDLQHRPEDIPALLAALSDDLDVVYGTPAREQHGAARNAASRITKIALQSAMGADTARLVSAFRVFRASLRDSFAESRNPGLPLDVMLTWGTTRFGACVVQSEPRRAGRSGYTFRRLMLHALNMVTGYSVLPLRLASVLALLFMVFGFAVLVFVIGRTLIQGAAVPGFAMISSLIAILSGVQLFSLGILGEYLARMHVRMMDSPPYAIRSTVP
jgi:undecaprenyl-phosphate 4-deoxy-4-formamido-L-arabinose transferase